MSASQRDEWRHRSFLALVAWRPGMQGRRYLAAEQGAGAEAGGGSGPRTMRPVTVGAGRRHRGAWRWWWQRQSGKRRRARMGRRERRSGGTNDAVQQRPCAWDWPGSWYGQKPRRGQMGTRRRKDAALPNLKLRRERWAWLDPITRPSSCPLIERSGVLRGIPSSSTPPTSPGETPHTAMADQSHRMAWARPAAIRHRPMA